MNVVQSDKRQIVKTQSKFKKELVRKDSILGIRGATIRPFTVSKPTLAPNKAPRYTFSNEISTCSRKPMGPPNRLPINLKRKILQSTSSKPESSSSGKAQPRVLASDSAQNTSNDFSTPRNRPTALRYISSSSRGGRTGTRSALSTSVSAAEPSVVLVIRALIKVIAWCVGAYCAVRVRVCAGAASKQRTRSRRDRSYSYITLITAPIICLAISAGRGMARGEIGMAAVDLKRPHLVLCQFSDTLLYTHTLTKINYFNPVEIIVPHTFYEGVQPNQLYQLIKDHYPLINLTTVQRKLFNDAAGRHHIQTLCAPQYTSVYIQVLQKFYALTAAAAVLKYVEYIQCVVFVRESLKIEYHSSENTMIIDIGTAVQLELVQPLIPSAGITCCLLGVLGPTYTVGGIRALRAAILQPSCNKDFIESRLDAVQDLIENDSGLMTDLQDVIKKLSDIDKILFLCMESSYQNMNKIGEAQLNQILLLKTTMECVPNLVEALSNASSGKLRKIKMDLETPAYNEITERIKQIIQDDAHLEKGAMGSLQRCFAVKPDINGLLDVARRTYSELIDDIQKIVEQLSETYDLPLRLNQNVTKGFHILLSIAPKMRKNYNVEELPPIFIQVHNSGACISMTTEELVVLDQQAKESLNEIQKMSNIVISSLLTELRPFMPSLYTLCENVAELDVLLAMAQESAKEHVDYTSMSWKDRLIGCNIGLPYFNNASSIGSYIRPEFNSYMDIRNSVHPLLDYNSQVMPVPNDIFASPEKNFTIITGPNMGGKSIYIKQIALMQIMAQLGCFLPATNAVLRLCDRIFSRIGFNDSVDLNVSTYVFEMKETQHILKGLTSSSLVIIDELCRGTCAEEGIGIAWTICEELLISNAFTFFTTHFLYLTRLQDLYFNVVNCHTAVIEEDSEIEDSPKRLIYQHKIEPGVTKIEHYGLSLATKTNLPEATVKLALELAELIGENTKAQGLKDSQKSDNEILYVLNAEIRQELRKNSSSREIIKPILLKFKEEHPQLIDRIKVQRNNSNQITDSTANYSTIPNSKRDAMSNDARNHFVLNDTNLNEDNSEVNAEQVSPLSAHLDTVDESVTRCDIKNDYASVRSSNQLLNSVLGNNEESFEEHELIVNLMDVDINDGNSELIEFGTFDHNMNEKVNDSLNYGHCKSIYQINMNDSYLNKYSTNINTECLFEETLVDDMMNMVETSSGSDLADAPTQIIEQYSPTDETESKKTTDLTFVDEELVNETVDEINAEFLFGASDIESIILTPPIDFRDL